MVASGASAGGSAPGTDSQRFRRRLSMSLSAVMSVIRHSVGLPRLAVTEAFRGPFDQAHDAVTRRCGNVLGKRRLEGLVVAAAVDVEHLRPWVVLVDGARHQRDLIDSGTVLRSVTVHVLLDFAHVAEYVWAAAHAFHKPGTTEAEVRVADHLSAILAGHAAWAAAEMAAQAERERLLASRGEAVDACERCLTATSRDERTTGGDGRRHVRRCLPVPHDAEGMPRRIGEDPVPVFILLLWLARAQLQQLGLSLIQLLHNLEADVQLLGNDLVGPARSPVVVHPLEPDEETILSGEPGEFGI